jgi:hypothetical protein
MTKALAMLFFMLSDTMFSIGLYRYLMQFDAPIPPPYPPLKTPAFAELQRRYGECLERMPSNSDDDDLLITTTSLDTHPAGCE